MKKKRSLRYTMLLISSVLLTAVIAEILIVFRMTARQTEETACQRVESAANGLTDEINKGCNQLLLLMTDASELLRDSSRDEILRQMFSSRIEMQTEDEHFTAIHAAGSNWFASSVPGAPEKYTPGAVDWFNGAYDSLERIFISSPYKSTITGELCVTFSSAVHGQDAVFALDFPVERFRELISELELDQKASAAIVTSDGTIAAAGSKELAGKSLTSELPECSAIFSLAKNSQSAVTADSGGKTQIAFRTGPGWTVIFSESSGSFYRSSYIQTLITVLISAAVITVIIIMYMMTHRSAKRAKEALDYKERFISQMASEIQEPLHKIISGSSRENIEGYIDPGSELAAIHEAGEKLSDKIEKMVSYSSIVRSEKRKDSHDGTRMLKINRRFRTIILAALLVVMGLSLYGNISYNYRWGKNRMQQELAGYNYQLSRWMDRQNVLLDMFGTLLSNNPQLLSSFDNTVSYLEKLTRQYPEISAAYLANPDLEHQVLMSNGWEPNPDYKVNERPWYSGAVSSKTGKCISDPYYDELTGFYCITFSKRVYRSDNGSFLGVFAIDFYMDKLISILDETYTPYSYAFMTDSSGNVINHPFGSFQINENSSTNILKLPYYSSVRADGDDLSFFSDYDDRLKTVIASKNGDSGFTVYAVRTLWSIYKDVFGFSLGMTLMLILCTVLVYKIMTSLISLQEQANRTLKESAEAAIAADAAKSSFLAQMSHEIRTPINAVLGLNEMINRETADPNILEYSDGIRSSGKTLLSLINSILDFSKIEDGKMEISPARYDTASLINDLVTSIIQRAQSKGLEFSVEADEQLPSAMIGDDMRISQVIMNLLTNAVKYTEKGSVKLIIKKLSENRDEQTAVIYVEVADTGIGIREEDRDALFESFQRLDEIRNRNIEGTGLGISIVTGLLQMMNSKLNVASVYGEGSQFNFTITQGVADWEPMGSYNERLKHLTESEARTTHIYAPDASVLVVDDNEMNLRVASGLLKINGIKPDTADSGAKALEMISAKLYNVIFLDHMMPDIDGIEVMRQIRQRQLQTSDTAVIALTANAVVGAKEMYLDAGFDDYISKPIEPMALERRLERFLPKYMVSYIDTAKPAPAQAPAEADSDSFTLDDLRSLHESLPEINMLLAMDYCMESKDFFFDTLDGYLQSDKADKMDAALSGNDTQGYQLLAHSLKSSSLTIGAEVLSDRARELELAAKAGNTELIKQKHPQLMSDYRKLLEEIRQVLAER